MVYVTGLYAGILGMLFLLLGVRITRMRYRKKIALLDGGDPEMIRAVRAHGNFSEYVPLILILMGAAELNDISLNKLHVIGSLLVIGRLCHIYALERGLQRLRWRQAGMAATYGGLIMAAATNLWLSAGFLLSTI